MVEETFLQRTICQLRGLEVSGAERRTAVVALLFFLSLSGLSGCNCGETPTELKSNKNVELHS